jgi:DMSO/TMAO reductase YedYZ molybdopterin-dependent catalytic subunit
MGCRGSEVQILSPRLSTSIHSFGWRSFISGRCFRPFLSYNPRMLLRFTNGALLTLLIVLTLTGLWGLAFTLHGWLFEVHRGAAWAVFALLPWKVLVASRSLRRGFNWRFDRSWGIVISIVLAVLAVLVLVLGLLWTWRLGPELIEVAGYRDTAVSWHWMLALALLVPLAVHAWRRWPKPRMADFTSRRGALKLLGLGAAGVTGWWAASSLANSRARPDSPRRFTGSVEQASFQGNGLPVTHSVGQGRIELNPSDWFLAVHGAVDHPFRVDYPTLLARPASMQVATLDCTTGWFSTQNWQGVPLMAVLEPAGLQPGAGLVRLRSVSGYLGDFTLTEAAEVLLATHVGGEVLSHWHGFPLRAVAPSRRGWFWVKWITEVEVLRVQQV